MTVMQRGDIMKKERMIAKRLLSLATVAVLIVTALAGCGKKKGDSDNLLEQAKSGIKDYVFRSEKLDLGDGADYNNVTLSGDRVYASTYSDNGFITISSFNSDGSDVKSFKIPEADNESYGYMSFDKEGNLFTILNIYNYDDFDDGEMHIMDEQEGAADGSSKEDSGAASDSSAEEKSADKEADEGAGSAGSSEEVADAQVDVGELEPLEEEGMGRYEGEMISDEQTYLVKFDPQGKELYRIDLLTGLEEDEYYGVYKMIYADDYGIIISSSKGIELFNDADKSFKILVDTRDSSSKYYQCSISVYNGFDGKLFASYWGDNGIEFMPFDASKGSFGEKSEALSTFDDYSFFSGNGYDLYVSKSDGFYGYDLAKDDLTKLLDYSDSDINLNYSINSVVAISDAEFIANIPDEEYNYSLNRLTKVPADQVKDRTIITLAGNHIDYTVRQKAYKFNKENADYKIKLVDYSTLSGQDDWNAGAKQFNLDIVSGNVPDIMYFNMDENVDSYINKGLFLDLMPFIKNDSELSGVEFVQNVFDAFKTGDKLYQLVPSFNVSTMAVKSSFVNGKDYLTIKDCVDMIEGKGMGYSEAFGLMSKETVLYNGINASGDYFIDWKNKKCNFSGDEFVELLEFANKFPQEVTEDMWRNYDDTAYFEDEALFMTTYISGFRAYKRTKDGSFGADITLTGFPNQMGVNCSVINPNMKFAISAHTKYSDACWELIREFLMEDYQDDLTYDFPIRKSSFDKQGKESMDRLYWIDSDGKKNYEDDIVYLGDQEIKINPLTQEEVDFVKNYISTLSMVNTPNENVYNIIQEEASAFFSGQKSAKEVADIIQSRLTIYVNENS